MSKWSEDVKKPTDKEGDQDTSKSITQNKPDLMKVHKSTEFDLKK